MESPRDPLPAYVSAEPDPTDPPPAVPRPRGPGESRPAARPPSRWTAAAAGRPRAARPEYQPADSRPGSPRPAVLRELRIHTVAWTGHGPRFSAFTQPLAARPRGELLRRRQSLPGRRDRRRHPLSPSRIPSTTTPLYPRRGTPRPRPACWAVLVVRRSSHEAHAALARGGVTYWNPGSSAS